MLVVVASSKQVHAYQYGARGTHTYIPGPCKYIPGFNDADTWKQVAAINNFLGSTFAPLGMDAPLLTAQCR